VTITVPAGAASYSLAWVAPCTATNTGQATP
jgi:hypothetical protein